MSTSTLIWGIRLLVGLSIGFILASKWKEGLRGLVIRCMPVKHRISEQSYLLQTRITTVVSILFAIVVATVLNLALSKGLQGIGWTLPTTQQTVSPRLIPLPPKPVPNVERKEAIDKRPIGDLDKIATPASPTKEIAIPPSNTTSQQIGYVPTSQSVYRPISPPCYLQLYAFHTFEKAQQQQARWIRQTPYMARIGYLTNDYAPYKVLLGPIPNRQYARQLQQQLTISSFIRAVDDIRQIK